MTSVLALFDGLGFAEMLVIAFVAILVFGGRLPEVMRNLGRSYARLRQGLQEMSRPIREELSGSLPLPGTQAPLPPGPSTGGIPTLPYAEPPSAQASPAPARPPLPPPGPSAWDEPPPV